MSTKPHPPYSLTGPNSDAWIIDSRGNDVIELVRLSEDYAEVFQGDKIMSLLCDAMNRSTTFPASSGVDENPTVAQSPSVAPHTLTGVLGAGEAVGDLDEEFDEANWCDRCGNIGSITCRCGGDICCCENNGEMECPDCSF